MLPTRDLRGRICLNYTCMKKYIVTLALAITACATARAMEIESVKFDGEADLNGWQISPSNCAIISGGVLQITNPVRAEKSRAEILKNLPKKKVAGRRIYVSRARARPYAFGFKVGWQDIPHRGRQRQFLCLCRQLYSPGEIRLGGDLVFYGRSARI